MPNSESAAASSTGVKRVALKGTSLPPMVSYAQNLEDVILRRALQDITAGFYVDVGAFNGTLDSVTRWFYDNKWRGVNVEPNPEFLENLKRDRPSDYNLWSAVSSRSGLAEFDIIGDSGLSTLLARERTAADQAGYPVSRRVQVPVLTLDQLLETHANNQTVDFLKIDAEGSESEILNAARFRVVRPRLVVVEAVRSFSLEPAWEGWEPNLIAQGFRFVWFDGLNRFYLREEDSWRESLFGIPPCLFDTFTIQHQVARLAADLELSQAEAARQMAAVGAELKAKAAEIAELREKKEAQQSFFQQKAQDLVDQLSGRETELAISQFKITAKVAECEAIDAACRSWARGLGARNGELSAAAMHLDVEKESQRVALEAKLQELLGRLNERETELAANRSQLAAKISQCEVLEAACDESARRLGERDAELALNRIQVAAKVSQCEAVEAAWHESARMLGEREVELVAKTGQIQALGAEREAAHLIFHAQMHDLGRQLGEREAELATKRIQLAAKVSESEAAEVAHHESARTLGGQLREHQREHLEELARYEMATAESENLSMRLRDREEKLARYESSLAELSMQTEEMAARLSATSKAKSDAELVRDALLASASWRITKPVRLLADVALKVVNR